MKLPARFHQLAEREFTEAAEYFERESIGLGAAFIAAVERCVAEIVEYPESGRRVVGTVRRRLVRRFPIQRVVLDQGRSHPSARRHACEATAPVLDRPRIANSTPIRLPFTPPHVPIAASCPRRHHLNGDFGGRANPPIADSEWAPRPLVIETAGHRQHSSTAMAAIVQAAPVAGRLRWARGGPRQVRGGPRRTPAHPAGNR